MRSWRLAAGGELAKGETAAWSGAAAGRVTPASSSAQAAVDQGKESRPNNVLANGPCGVRSCRLCGPRFSL